MTQPAREKARRLWQRPVRKEEVDSTTALGSMTISWIVDSDGFVKPGLLRFSEPQQWRCPACGRADMNLPSERLAALRADIVELARRRENLRAEGYPTRKLDSLIAAKQRTLELLEQVADDLRRVAGRRQS